MARTFGSRRLLATLVGACTVAALVAGCGGSDVQEGVSGPAPAAVNDATGTAPTQADVSSGEVGAAPGSTETSPGAAVPADGGSGANTSVKTGGRATSPGGQTTKTTKGAATSTTAGGSAVERLVSSHPLFGGTAACKPATLAPVPVGNVSTLSGVLGELFAPVRSALDVFVASQNACGGLNGHLIKLYFEDDQGDPSTAASKAQSLIQDKKVLAFVGNIQVLTIDAVIPIVKRAGIPIIGGDGVSDTWFTNPMLFPESPPAGAQGWGYLVGATEYFKKNKVGDIWCIEVPRACEQLDRTFKEIAPKLGATVLKSIQSSITAPSYVQQCLEFKNAGVEVLVLIMDAASMNRLARSCEQVGYHPNVIPTALGVGNEAQLLSGKTWLGNAYIPMYSFPWFASETPAEKYYQAAVKKYNPGFATGSAATIGWSSAAMLVAAAADLPAAPTTADILKGLYAFQGQKFTELGGLTGPRTFRPGSTPIVPYCLFAGVSNAANTGWVSSVNKARCTTLLAPSDPQNR